MKIAPLIYFLYVGASLGQTIFFPNGSVMFGTNGGTLFTPLAPAVPIVFPINVQFVQGNSAGSQTVVLSPTTKGDTIIVFAGDFNLFSTGPATGCSDDAGNAYVLVTNHVSTLPNLPDIACFICTNCLAGAQNITVTPTLSSSWNNMSAMEYNGVSQYYTWAEDDQSGATCVLPMAVTNASVFVAATFNNPVSTSVIGSDSWSDVQTSTHGGFTFTTGDWLKGGTGYPSNTYTPTITPSSTGNVALGIALGGTPYITNYFVDNAGSDANIGSQASPFKTLGRAITNAQAGTLAHPTMIYLSANGTAETFTNDYMTGVNSFVTICSLGAQCIVSNTASSNVFQFFGCSGITISNVTVRGWAFNNTNIYADIAFFAGNTSQATNTSVVNCDLGLADYGINRFVSTSANPQCFNNKYDSGNNIHDIIYYGAKTWYSGEGVGTVLATNPVTLNTTFSNIIGIAIATQGEAGSGTGECIYGPVGWLASNCVCAVLGWNQGNTNFSGSPQGCAGLFNYSGGWGNHYIKITGYSIKATTNGGDGALIDCDKDSLSNIVEQCYARDCGGPGIESDLWGFGNRVCWNVVTNCGTNAINNGALRFNGENTAGTNYVYNNTIYGLNNLSLVIAGTNIVFANNILQGNGISVDAFHTNSSRFNGNNYPITEAIAWGGANFSTTASWTNGTLQDIGCNIGVVSFSGAGTPPANLQLHTASPLVGAGKDIATLYGINAGTLDYLGGTVLSSGNNVGGLVGSVP